MKTSSISQYEYDKKSLKSNRNALNEVKRGTSVVLLLVLLLPKA